MPDDFLDELLSSIDERNGSFSDEDKKLAPLLQEVLLIQDQTIRLFVRAMLLAADEFWDIPSSFSGNYHPPDEHGHGGNVLHTKRVARTVLFMCESQQRTAYETDLLLAAALIHDLTKGVDWYGEVRYDPMHAYTVDKFLERVRLNDEKYVDSTNRSTTLYLDNETIAQILRLVRCHMGPWSPIPETIPITSLDWILHMADNLASKVHVIVDGPDVKEWRWYEPGGPDLS